MIPTIEDTDTDMTHTDEHTRTSAFLCFWWHNATPEAGLALADLMTQRMSSMNTAPKPPSKCWA